VSPSPIVALDQNLREVVCSPASPFPNVKIDQILRSGSPKSGVADPKTSSATRSLLIATHVARSP
jgi:hypothetical protein